MLICLFRFLFQLQLILRILRLRGVGKNDFGRLWVHTGAVHLGTLAFVMSPLDRAASVASVVSDDDHAMIQGLPANVDRGNWHPRHNRGPVRAGCRFRRIG